MNKNWANHLEVEEEEYEDEGEDEEEIDDIAFVDDMLQEEVIPKVVERIEITRDTSSVLSFISLFISLIMFIIGIVAIIKIGWLVGLFMIFCSLLVPMVIVLIRKISDLALYNHMFLSVIQNDVRNFTDDFYGGMKIVDIVRADTLRTDTGRNKISRNDQCPCRSGKKYKKCCGS